MNELRRGQWYIEFLRKDEIHGHKVRRRVAAAKTPYQTAEVVDTHDYGRCLFLDGLVQSTEADEFIYHEALVHPGLMLHPRPETVFIAGGGEGAALREILKHPSVRRIDMAEIDVQVVALARKHLKAWHCGAYGDPRVRLHIGDARAFLEGSDAAYDFMVLDLCDPGEEGPARKLYTVEFYRLLRSRLARGGLVVIQGGSANINMLEGYARVYRSLRKNFRAVLPYRACVHSYVGQWGYFLAADALPASSPGALERRFRERKLAGRTRFYDPGVHSGLFAQPPYVRDILKRGKAITDRRLLVKSRKA